MAYPASMYHTDEIYTALKAYDINKLTSQSWIYIPKDDHRQAVIIQSGSTELCSRVLTSAKVKVIISGRECVSVELFSFTFVL